MSFASRLIQPLEQRRLFSAILPGDANVDGLVSGDDYSTIDFNILVPNAEGYANGDFNLDGFISGDDYSLIDFNIGLTNEDVTGPTKPELLVPRNGFVTLDDPGEVLENFDLKGEIFIEANNVVVRNFRIASNGFYGITVVAGVSGVVIEDGEITGAKSAAIRGGGFTARRLNLHDLGSDAIKPGSNVVVESCWIHHIGTLLDSHADAMQIKTGEGDYVSNIVFRNNLIDVPDEPAFRANSAFIIDPEEGPVWDIFIEGNWLNGGGFTVHVVEGTTNVVFMNNHFGRDAEFGVNRISDDVLWRNNCWWDTGAPAG